MNNALKGATGNKMSVCEICLSYSNSLTYFSKNTNTLCS